MEDRLLQEEISLSDTPISLSKRPASQTIFGDATRAWINT